MSETTFDHRVHVLASVLKMEGLRRMLHSWLREEQHLPLRQWLRPPVLSAAALSLAGLLALDATLRHRTLQREHEGRLRESVAILTATLAGVERSALDWGHWNSMYAWMQGRNPSFVSTDVETTPLFDEGGLFLILDGDGRKRLSYGRKGHDHPSYAALFRCLEQHLHRLPTLTSRIGLLCRSGEGELYLGVATPLTNSLETAAALGTLAMFEPLLKSSYGPAFNRPLEWLSRRMRRIAPDGEPPPRQSSAEPAPEAAAPLATGDRRERLPLNRALYTSAGQVLTLKQEPLLPALLGGLGRDLLLAASALTALLTVRMLLLRERRRVRLQQRRSERESNRRIRRASHELDRLLARLGASETGGSSEETVLAKLIDGPGAPAVALPAGTSMERKLKGLADRFQHFLDRARHLALLDPLTQLPNRRYFIEQMQLTLANGREVGQRFAILFVDIDKFKNINDSYGHAVGDAALIRVADTLRSLTSRHDFLGRYGGDEFAILIDLANSEAQDSGSDYTHRLESYARRIIEPFQQSVQLAGFRVTISISVGISLIDGREPDFEAAMRRSDIAMYRAKQNSQNRIVIFNHAEASTHLDNYQLYVDLMQAIQDRQFTVLFQPILDQHGHLHALEALSRWNHPSLGIVGPDVFVDIAERYRQMNPLSDELISLSLSSFQDLKDKASELRLSLNLPPSKLSDPQLIDGLTQQLEQHNISPEKLTIELTERSVLQPNALVNANLTALRKAGVAISLDDFGTGYSSLSLLSTLQPDEVKIDKSFVMAMQQDDYARQIISLIADMAPRMNLRVVAEGVEDEATLNQLRAIGIRYFQGYHFSRPLSLAQLRDSAFWTTVSTSRPAPASDSSDLTA